MKKQNAKEIDNGKKYYYILLILKEKSMGFIKISDH